MTTKYVSPTKWQAISKGKRVKDFPNPAVKEMDGVRYEIVDNPTCTIRKFEEEDYPWFIGLRKDLFMHKYGGEVYELTVVDGFFPIDLVAGVKNGMFSEDADLSRETGWLSSRNLGTAGEAFNSSKVNNAIKILRKNGFMFDFIEE